jgi:hypothetical protein
MNTKLIMTLSALFLALIGLTLTFLPEEIMKLAGVPSSKTFLLILQILGALYFGFALLNWMAKGSTIGGIYNRPISIANFTHFLIGGLALIKGLMNNLDLPFVVWILTGLYSIFAVLFGFVFSRNPVSDKKVNVAKAEVLNY